LIQALRKSLRKPYENQTISAKPAEIVHFCRVEATQGTWQTTYTVLQSSSLSDEMGEATSTMLTQALESGIFQIHQMERTI
jgi:hypothetical protein